eukprot:3065381-Rhodomonas_salina.1
MVTAVTRLKTQYIVTAVTIIGLGVCRVEPEIRRGGEGRGLKATREESKTFLSLPPSLLPALARSRAASKEGGKEGGRRAGRKVGA